jgi:DNA-binding NtrC family response regulator
MAMRSILIVKADKHVRERLAALLRQEIECVVLEAEHPDVAQVMLKKEPVCLLITDLFLPEKKGLDLQRATRQLNPETATIVCVPEGAREANVEAMRNGAFSTIKEPYDLIEVVIAAARGLQFYDLLVHRAQQGRKFRKSEGCHGILGASAPMRRLFDIIEKVAEDDRSTVLIQGETGTGKELVARAIHGRGPRQGKNLVPVNCAAIPDELLESELFGYVKGAFTGATASKIGRVQYADGGTLFLDEIGDMKPSLQAKLLRVLQEKEFEPLGGVKPVPVDVRVIAATHRDLEKAVADGTFREDLYYRLSVMPLHIPPLRERKEDIQLLIDKFVQAFNRNRQNAFLGFEPKALEGLTSYAWPGNVRELENLVQRMAILHGGAMATLQDLPEKYVAHMGRPAPATPASEGHSVPPEVYLLQQGGRIDFNALVEEFEARLILQALEVTGGNKKEAALLLSLNRTTLLEKIKKKQLEITL